MKIFVASILFITTEFLTSLSPEPRTDGKPGSEYGDFSNWDYQGRIKLGADFGALLPNDGDVASTLALGVHASYNPLDLVGIRLNLIQSLQRPRNSLFSLGATGSVDLANVRPFVFFGPGVQIAHYGDTLTKFMLQLGFGAEVLVTDHLGFGLNYSYSMVFDILDTHYIGASVAYTF